MLMQIFLLCNYEDNRREEPLRVTEPHFLLKYLLLCNYISFCSGDVLVVSGL